MYERALDKIMEWIVLYMLPLAAVMLAAALLIIGGYAIYDFASSGPSKPDKYINHCVAYNAESYITMLPTGKAFVPMSNTRQVCTQYESRVRICGKVYRITGMEAVQ